MSSIYRIRLTPRADREIHRLARRAQVRIGQVLADLAIDPKPPHAFMLDGPHCIFRISTNPRRFARLPDYRLIYQLDEHPREVWVLFMQEWKSPVAPEPLLG